MRPCTCRMRRQQPAQDGPSDEHRPREARQNRANESFNDNFRIEWLSDSRIEQKLGWPSRTWLYEPSLPRSRDGMLGDSLVPWRTSAIEEGREPTDGEHSKATSLCAPARGPWMTRADLARQLGCSRAWVSRVLGGAATEIPTQGSQSLANLVPQHECGQGAQEPRAPARPDRPRSRSSPAAGQGSLGLFSETLACAADA